MSTPATTPDKMFDEPVVIHVDGHPRSIGSVRQALDALSGTDWPGERGPRHRDAVETCLKVIDGHRSTIDAQQRFAEAAGEAGILARDS